MPDVLLHAAVTGGLTALAILAGLAVFVFVLAYVISALQRDDPSREGTENTRRRAR